MSFISARTRLGLELYRIYRAIQTHMHDLNYLFWECTLRCNLKCLHCGSDCTRDSDIPDMQLSDFLGVLDRVAQQYNPNKVMIAVTGGEPLLRNDLETCGKEFYRRGFPWGMVTNGYLLTSQRLHALCQAGLRSLTISLDGLEESHNWLRRKNNQYSTLIQAISYCARQNDIVFDVVTCVNKRNLQELIKVKELLLSLGVRKWRLFTIFPKGRAKDIEDLNLSSNEFRQLLDFIADTRKQKSIEASYGCEGFLGNYEGLVRDGYFFCRAGINISSVLADGSISACPSLRDDFIQGTIYKDDFLDCWNNRYKKLRNRSWAKTSKYADCKEFTYCAGNGLHLRDGENSRLLMCHYNKIKRN